MFVASLRASSGGHAADDFGFRPAMAAGGMQGDADRALTLPTAWACVRNISEDVAKLPFVVYRQTGTSRERVTDHWIYRLFNSRPNDWQSPFEFREMLQGHLELRGNAYARIVANGRGEITGLVPLHPLRVRIEVLPDGGYRYRYRDDQGREEIILRGDMWHIRGFGGDGYVGYSPVQLHRMTLGLGLSAQEYAERFFRNDARPAGGWIEFPGSFKDRETKKKWRDSFQSLHGGENQGRVMVLDQGMKYHTVGMNNRDSQFLETQMHGAYVACSIWRMPPHKVGLLDKATFSNIEHQGLEYATDTIHGRCERLESSIESQLLGEDSGLEVEFDLRILMRGDSKARADRSAALVNAGIITRNEARADEGLNPIDGLDAPLRPLNMAEESHADDGGDDLGPLRPDDAPSSRLVAITRSAAERVARKEVAAIEAALRSAASGMLTESAINHIYSGKFAEFVAQCLALDAQSAIAYCEKRKSVVQSYKGLNVDDAIVSTALELERLALGVTV